MQRTIIGFALSLAPFSLAMAVLAAGYSQQAPRWWTASVELAILGGITIMIYGVNVDALPTHSGKPWKSLPLVAMQVASGVIGAWLTFLGSGFGNQNVNRMGHALATVGAVLFLVNLMLLFRQPGPRPERVAPHLRTMQQRVDRAAIPFTMMSGFMVVIGTALGLLLTWWRPTFGRWDLVWAHVMLLGFFFAMASGTSYHVLSRWSGVEFRSLAAVRWHRLTYLISFPLMVIALGWDVDWMFLIGGPLMAIAMGLWALNIVPVLGGLMRPIRWGVLLALVFLAVGVALGVWFAIDPVMGARLRTTHVAANLYGFAGFLISGFGYSYIPRLAGHGDHPWPILGLAQLGIMLAGIVATTVTMGLRMYGHVGEDAVLMASAVSACGLLMLALQAIALFLRKPGSR